MILEGIRVIDFTQMIAGPYAGSILGDLGAEVIHIEQPNCGDRVRGLLFTQGHSTALPGGRHALYEYLNRNKRSFTCDVKKLAGKDIMSRLLARSDVFLTNMGVELLAEAGLDYARLHATYPKLVYVSASSYGAAGPDAAVPGYDLVAQAKSGLMTLSGEAGFPSWAAPGLVDQACGMTLALATLGGLLGRERLGITQAISTSLLGAAIALEAYPISFQSLLGHRTGKEPREKASNPIFNWYHCADGRWLALGMLQADRYWAAFCDAIERPDLRDDQRFSDIVRRREHAVELIAILDEVFAAKPAGEWATTLRKADLIATPIQTIDDVLKDPQAAANDYIVEADHPVLGRVKLVGSPISYSETPATIRSFAPECGEHTEEILVDLGYDWETIGQFREEGIV